MMKCCHIRLASVKILQLLRMCKKIWLGNSNGDNKEEG